MTLESPLDCPVGKRLTRQWQREDDVVRGLRFHNLQVLFLVTHGYAERRQRWFRKGWWIRLADGQQD